MLTSVSQHAILLASAALSLMLVPPVAGLPYYGNDGNLDGNQYAIHRRSSSNDSSAHLNDATGYKGAAACVRILPSLSVSTTSNTDAYIFQEVGVCSDIGVDILKKGGNAADGQFKTVGYSCARGRF